MRCLMSRRPMSRRLCPLTWIVLALPLVFYLARVPRFSRLPHNDYYSILSQLTEGDRLRLDPRRLLEIRSNEHRVSLPAVVYALNLWLTRGHNLGLSVFSLVLMAVVFAVLYGLLPADVRGSPAGRLLVGLPLAILCFTPVAAHSVTLGFSGSIWFLSNVFAVAAISALCRRRPLWAVVFTALGALTYSTHLPLWPILFAGAWLLRFDRRRLALLAAAASLGIAFFATFYRTPANSPEPTTGDLLALARYAAVYLGTLFSGDPATAGALGGLGLVASLVFQARTWRSRPPGERVPWLLLQLFAVGNALGTAVGRAGFGVEQALSSRYASVAALFWAGFLTSLGLWLWRRLQPARRYALLALLLPALAVPTYLRGNAVIAGYLNQGTYQPMAALGLLLGVRDDEIAQHGLTPAPKAVWALRDFLRASGHVSFDRPFERPRLAVAAEQLRGRSPRLRGVFSQEQPVDGGCRYMGWAWSSDAEVEEVVLVDRDGRLGADVVTGIFRPDVAEAVDPAALYSGWGGYGTRGCDSVVLLPYVRLAGADDFYALAATDPIRRDWRRRRRQLAHDTVRVDEPDVSEQE